MCQPRFWFHLKYRIAVRCLKIYLRSNSSSWFMSLNSPWITIEIIFSTPLHPESSISGHMALRVNRAFNPGQVTFHFCESRLSREDDSASATAMPLPLATNAAGRQNTSEICAFLSLHARLERHLFYLRLSRLDFRRNSRAIETQRPPTWIFLGPLLPPLILSEPPYIRSILHSPNYHPPHRSNSFQAVPTPHLAHIYTEK
jgi:hypothetical protein